MLMLQFLTFEQELARDSSVKLAGFELAQDGQPGRSTVANTSVVDNSSETREALDAVFRACHNRRIWNELFKVCASNSEGYRALVSLHN